MANDYTEKLIDGIQTLIDGKVKDLKFDRTIEALITDDSQKEKGIYQIQVNNQKMQAFALSGTSYFKNETVYVKIPQGDFSKNKFITGRKTDEDATAETYSYKPALDDFASIKTWAPSTNQLSVRANSELVPSLTYYKKSDSNPFEDTYNLSKMSVEFDVETHFAQTLVSGTYGLAIELLGRPVDFIKADETITETYTFSSEDMFGTIYNFSDPTHQEKIFDISKFDRLYSIELYLVQDKNFKNLSGDLINQKNEENKKTKAEDENKIVIDVLPDNIVLNNICIAIGDYKKNLGNGFIYLTTDSDKTYTPTKKKEAKDDDTSIEQSYLFVHWILKQADGTYKAMLFNGEDEKSKIKNIIGSAKGDDDKIRLQFWCKETKAVAPYTSNITDATHYLGSGWVDYTTEAEKEEGAEWVRGQYISKQFDEDEDNTVFKCVFKYDDKVFISNELEYQNTMTRANREREKEQALQNQLESMNNEFNGQIGNMDTQNAARLQEVQQNIDSMIAAEKEYTIEICYKNTLSGTEEWKPYSPYNLFYVYNEQHRALYDPESQVRWSDKYFRARVMQIQGMDNEGKQKLVPVTMKDHNVSWAINNDDGNMIVLGADLGPQTEDIEDEEKVTQTTQVFYFQISALWDESCHNTHLGTEVKVYTTDKDGKIITDENGVKKPQKTVNPDIRFDFGQAETWGSYRSLRISEQGNHMPLMLTDKNSKTYKVTLVDTNTNQPISFKRVEDIELTWIYAGTENPISKVTKKVEGGAILISIASPTSDFIPPVLKVTAKKGAGGLTYDISTYYAFDCLLYVKGENTKPQNYLVGVPNRIEFKSNGEIPLYDQGDFEVQTWDKDETEKTKIYPDWTWTYYRNANDATGSSFLRLVKHFITIKNDDPESDKQFKSVAEYALSPVVRADSVDTKHWYWTENKDINEFMVLSFEHDGWRYSQAVAFAQNMYSSTLVNHWDGESLTYDDKHGAVLAKVLTAGSKDNRNRYTGIMLGDLAEVTDASVTRSKVSTGIWGFDKGQQAFGFRSNGTAFIGKAGNGQIIFDGNKGKISSANEKCYMDLDPLDGEYFLHASYDNGDYFRVGSKGVETSGIIKAKDGKIGNWLIHNNGLEQIVENEDGTKSAYIRLGRDSKNPDAAAIWAGPNNITSNFSVSWNGALKATTGTIGPWAFTDKYLTREKENGTIYLGQDGVEIQDGEKEVTVPYAISAGGNKYGINAPFGVKSDGTLYSAKGTIGGWEIGADTLQSKDKQFILDSTNQDITIKDKNQNIVAQMSASKGISLASVTGQQAIGTVNLAGYMLRGRSPEAKKTTVTTITNENNTVTYTLEINETYITEWTDAEGQTTSTVKDNEHPYPIRDVRKITTNNFTIKYKKDENTSEKIISPQEFNAFDEEERAKTTFSWDNEQQKKKYGSEGWVFLLTANVVDQTDQEGDSSKNETNINVFQDFSILNKPDTAEKPVRGVTLVTADNDKGQVLFYPENASNAAYLGDDTHRWNIMAQDIDCSVIQAAGLNLKQDNLFIQRKKVPTEEWVINRINWAVSQIRGGSGGGGGATLADLADRIKGLGGGLANVGFKVTGTPLSDHTAIGADGKINLKVELVGDGSGQKGAFTETITAATIGKVTYTWTVSK